MDAAAAALRELSVDDIAESITVMLPGQVQVTLPGPANMSVAELAALMEDPRPLLDRLTGPDVPPVTLRVARAVWRDYQHHFDIPSLPDLLRLGELLRRYRPEIRADLSSKYGVDLGDLVSARRFRAILDYIEQLPRASHYAEAVMNDPEQAEMIARQRERADDEDAPRWSPPLREFGLEAQMMRDLIHELRVLVSTTIAAAGGKPGAIKEYPAPVTEVDRAIARIEKAWAESVLTRYGFDAGDL